MISHFILGSARHELLTHVEGDSDSDNDDETTQSGSLRSYDEVVKHLLATYADNSTISVTDSTITALQQRENQAPVTFKNVIFNKISHCGKVYSHDTRICLFLQGPNPAIQYHARHYRSEHPTCTLDSLARHFNEIDRKSDGSMYTTSDDCQRSNIDDRRRGGNRNENRDGYNNACSTPLIATNDKSENTTDVNYTHQPNNNGNSLHSNNRALRDNNYNPPPNNRNNGIKVTPKPKIRANRTTPATTTTRTITLGTSTTTPLG